MKNQKTSFSLQGFDFLAFFAKSLCRPYPAEERHEVMFTERKHLYVFDDHNFLVVFIKDGIIQDICRSNIRRAC